MLHELLVALSGHSGSFFSLHHEITSNPEDSLNSFEDIIAAGIDHYYHPSEKGILKKLIHLASLYKRIQQFYTKYGGNLSGIENEANEDGLRGGLYLTAFAISLNEECLDYQKNIVLLEREILEEGKLPLNVILLRMDPFFPIMTVLCQLIGDIEGSKAHGCKLLESIHHLAITSVGPVKESLLRVEQCVHKVLLDQLTQWMLYGTLHDPHQELFVLIAERQSRVTPSLISLQQEEDPHLEDIVRPKDCKFGNLEVVFRLEMLPDHIPSSIAEKIVFIGESIIFFKEAKQRRKSCESLELCQKNEMRKETKFNFAPLLQQLSTQSSPMKNFLKIIENVRQSTAEHMSELVKVAGLVTELTNIKAIYLLGTGELYQAFFHLADHHLKVPVSHALNVNGMFHKAGHQVLMEGSTLDKFTLLLQKPHKNSQDNEAVIGWKQLWIEYKVDWPLHQIFGEKIQERYNSILQFLLQIRRAQHTLQRTWIQQMRNKKSTRDPLKTQVWMLRHHMSLLIYNLQCYIQVDVLESRYWELIQEISQTKDYQRLVRLHNNFVSSLIGQCFLNHPMLNSSINKILEQIHSFCDCFSDVDVVESKSFQEKIKRMWEEFDRSAGIFFCILSTLGQHSSGQHTAQLITRIDYNMYYSCKTSAKRFLDQVYKED